ncbi:MAG: DUF4857 domain-containing protein [Alistipes indistinctus]
MFYLPGSCSPTAASLSDTLRGVALTPQTALLMQSFYFRNSPSDINKVKPELYPLSAESHVERGVDSQMPPDVFRIHDSH